MVTAIEPLLREQLIDRRQKLTTAASTFHRPAELTRLLEEVDAALHRMEIGTYGLCRRKSAQRRFDVDVDQAHEVIEIADRQHCCATMESQLNTSCDQHADPFKCADSLIRYSPQYVEYGIMIHDGDVSFHN
ncbi:MAG: hypothetical protein ABJC10_12240 [Acidobacteriota bacterium]